MGSSLIGACVKGPVHDRMIHLDHTEDERLNGIQGTMSGWVFFKLVLPGNTQFLFDVVRRIQLFAVHQYRHAIGGDELVWQICRTRSNGYAEDHAEFGMQWDEWHRVLRWAVELPLSARLRAFLRSHMEKGYRRIPDG